VDISDPQRSFSNGEVQQLGPSGRQYITTIQQNDSSRRTVKEIVSWYSHYGPAFAAPGLGGHTGNLEISVRTSSVALLLLVCFATGSYVE
jgi:hypothetical protein